ncbi:MAG: sugar phosphate isomerase/epimerase, partial [Victivallales bacterium]|nr:sugar phosphate isomerase/epimerase [Victivallales bacterium]
KLGVVLALENHGGLPCTGEEQVEIIESVNSPFLKATVDVGNYMQVGQEGQEGTAVAAHLAAYVHFKDFKKILPAEGSRIPWELQTCTVGEGDVEHIECLKTLKKAGYKGYVALEYEGSEDEKVGVPKSLDFTRKVIQEVV